MLFNYGNSNSYHGYIMYYRYYGNALCIIEMFYSIISTILEYFNNSFNSLLFVKQNAYIVLLYTDYHSSNHTETI